MNNVTECNLEEINKLPDICSYCQEPYDGLINQSRSKTIDHILPQRGWNRVWKSRVLYYNHIDNLLLCCKRCNRFKGDMSLMEFRAAVARNNHSFFVLSKREQINILNSIDVLIYDRALKEQGLIN